jgi:hypothetical protein
VGKKWYQLTGLALTMYAETPFLDLKGSHSFNLKKLVSASQDKKCGL